MKNLKVYQIFLLFVLLFITLCIYMPMLNAGYSPTDDWLMLKSYSGALKSLSLNYIINTFKHFHEGLYHPLVTLSYSLEVTIFGFVPAVFHLDNILLHLINIFLVFFIFFKLSKNNYWVGFVVATLFALHPTRVEAVAWISARKDLLYAPFYLLSILFYLKYNETPLSISNLPIFQSSNPPSVVSRSRRLLYIVHYTLYIASIGTFLLSCFSKSMAITLPFVLILIDFYTNNFSKKDIKKYIPYFIIALIFIVIAVASHYNEAELAVKEWLRFSYFRAWTNFLGAHFNILFYLDKFLLPINLYCIYPYFYDMSQIPPWFILCSPLVLYLLIYFVCLSLKKNKLIFFGFIFFIVTLLPVCGIFSIGKFVVADRYTYIPYLGLFFIFAELIMLLIKKVRHCEETLLTKQSRRFHTSILQYIYTSIIVVFCLSIIVSLGQLSYERVLDWKENVYGAPTKMKYYEFGINKKSAKELKLYKEKRKLKR